MYNLSDLSNVSNFQNILRFVRKSARKLAKLSIHDVPKSSIKPRLSTKILNHQLKQTTNSVTLTSVTSNDCLCQKCHKSTIFID